MNPIFYVDGDEIGVEIDRKRHPASKGFLHEVSQELQATTARLRVMEVKVASLSRELGEAREDSISLEAIRDIVGRGCGA